VSDAIEVAAAKVKTRLGPVWVIATRTGIREIRFGASGRPSGRALKREGLRLVWMRRWTEPARRLLARYFEGRPVDFDVPLDLSRGTPFERRVWDATRRVPYGGTASYGTIASRIGSPRAARAVGNALGQNPVPIVIPCHRVILGSRALGGFSGGPGWKRFLVDLERGQLAMPLRGRARKGGV
jgi:methylated-DNA-[protein]-cysteine S-methyltransferase